MRWSLFLSFICIFILLPQAARSETPSPITGDFLELKRIKSGRVDTVIDALTLRLKDGTIIRLSGLEVPGYSLPEPSDIAAQSYNHLKTLLKEGTEIILYQTKQTKKGRINRMGHHLAHLETKKDQIWIQGTILAEGHARAYPSEDTPEMASQMYAQEQRAQKAKKGIWQENTDWPILRPESAGNGIGAFQIVEGIVLKIASVKNNIYLNFGSDWRRDLTIMITPKTRRQLIRNNIDPHMLTGQHIRARGWLRSYNGPFMELTHPSRLEIIKPPKPALSETE